MARQVIFDRDAFCGCLGDMAESYTAYWRTDEAVESGEVPERFDNAQVERWLTQWAGHINATGAGGDYHQRFAKAWRAAKNVEQRGIPAEYGEIDVDAEIIDSAVQYGLFGEVRYA